MSRALLVSLVFVTGGSAVGASTSSQLPDAPGKATVQKICSGCHAAEIVLGRHETKERWTEIVSNMVDRGANGTDDEFNTVIDYLATQFPDKADKNSGTL